MRSWAAAGLDGGRFLGSCPVDPFGPQGAILASKESHQRWNRSQRPQVALECLVGPCSKSGVHSPLYLLNKLRK